MTVYQCVGIDVAKDKFDSAYFLHDKPIDRIFTNDDKGRQDFVNWLKKNTENPWVCMEATGHYSELIAEHLAKQGIKVSVVNPLQIKSYARIECSRNKNDTVDARIIAKYCAAIKQREFIPRSDSQKELKDLTKVLDMLKSQLVQLKNQLESIQGQLAMKSLKKIVKTLESKSKAVEKQLADHIKGDEDLEHKMELITSIKGVGKLTAYKLLGQVPNINIFSTAKQFAAYIGISPKQHQSGNFKGKTTISRIGDGRLRKAFYMAALSAKQHNEDLQPFVKRLQGNGKAPKSIICAVMRKLAHLIFGILKNNRPFDPLLV